MNNNIIIAISGYARSGKDTLARNLALEWGKHEQADFIVFKFADTLRKSLKDAFRTAGLAYVDPWTEDAEMKKAIRPLLVEFGAYCRTINRDVWVNATLKEIERSMEAANTPLIPIISDLRYFNEIQRVESWAKNLKTPRIVWHLHIEREDVVAANEEERRSVSELLMGHSPTFCETFKPGDIDGIADWAKRLVRPWGVTPEWLQDGNTKYADPKKGAPVDPTKVKAYLPHGVPSSWHGPNGEPIFVDKTVPVFGHTHNPTPASTEEQLKALWEESHNLDEAIDRVSIRVDDISDRLASHFQKANDADEQLLGIKLALERIDARLKRLEVARG